MQFINPNFLVIGLENGAIYGWTLSTNSLDKIEAHKTGIMTLKKH